MKNSSKKIFPRKNNKDYKQNSDFGCYSKNTKRSVKNERFLNNSAKNKNIARGCGVVMRRKETFYA